MILSRYASHKEKFCSFGLVVSAAFLSAAIAAPIASAKDIAPQNAACDPFAKGGTAWRQCAGAVKSNAADDELFYVGYWLTKSGRHAEALKYLNRIKLRTDRVLTYIGYATRKSGDVENALGYYNAAIALNPDFVIARSYLGEAHLTRGDRKSATHELDEIAKRCGTNCAAYIELANAVQKFDANRG